MQKHERQPAVCVCDKSRLRPSILPECIRFNIFNGGEINKQAKEINDYINTDS